MKVDGANKLSAWSIAATQIRNGVEPAMGTPPLYLGNTVLSPITAHAVLFSRLPYFLH